MCAVAAGAGAAALDRSGVGADIRELACGFNNKHGDVVAIC